MAEQICTQCNTVNRGSARFCANCGAPLLSDLQPNETAPAPTIKEAQGIRRAEEGNVILAGRYRLERELGRGGFGAVYEAWDINLNHRCAVKENLDTSPDAFRQFGREASILANLSHPNLPRVTDHFTIPNKGQYLVMDFVDGEDLENQLKRVGSIALDQAMFWIFQVTDALEYLHEQPQPIIHRDIKPANIRVTPQGKAMLVDFGLVKLYDPLRHTTLGARAVTPGFAPPEQYGRGKTDARSDIYALGATLYTILTGSEPMESVQRMFGELLEPTHLDAAAVPQALVQVINQSMALDPIQRYQTVAQFRSALQQSLADLMAAPQTLVMSASSKNTTSEAEALPPPDIHLNALSSRRAKTRWLTIIGGSILIIMCIGMISLFGSLAYYNTQASLQVTQTVQSHQTLAARMLATQTAQEGLIAGYLGTTTISAPLPTQPAFNPPAWPEKFSESFDGPGSTFWIGTDTSNEEFEQISAALQNGAYHLEFRGIKKPKAYWWTKSPQLQTGSDFILTLKSSISNGADDTLNGLIFHLDDQASRFYLFGVNRMQQFGVWLVNQNGFTILHPLENAPSITSGVNELTVLSQSGHYQFFVNGSQVGELTDATLFAGGAGMYFAAGSAVSATFEADHIQLKTP